MRQKPSEEPLWIGIGLESLLGVLACSAIFMSPSHWTLKVGFTATLALVMFVLDTHEASNEWGRQLHAVMIATLAERLDASTPDPTRQKTLERMLDVTNSRRYAIMSGGGDAEWQLIIFQLRCGLWISGGIAIAYFLGPVILRAYP